MAASALLWAWNVCVVHTKPWGIFYVFTYILLKGSLPAGHVGLTRSTRAAHRQHRCGSWECSHQPSGSEAVLHTGWTCLSHKGYTQASAELPFPGPTGETAHMQVSCSLPPTPQQNWEVKQAQSICPLLFFTAIATAGPQSCQHMELS